MTRQILNRLYKQEQKRNMEQLRGCHFRVGDRVKACGNNWYNVMPNDTGTVIYVLDYANVGVQWDRNVGGHSCDGRGFAEQCTWEIPYNLSLIDEGQFDDPTDAWIAVPDNLI